MAAIESKPVKQLRELLQVQQEPFILEILFPSNCLNLQSTQTLQHSTSPMAAVESKPVKQLRELLQEQQEPFILEIYLTERGHMKKNLNSESSFSCCRANSRSIKKWVSCDLNMSRRGVPHRFKVLKTIYNQVISIKERLRINNCSNHKDRKLYVTEKGRNNQEVAELERLSSASSTTVFNSCSESDIEETSTSLQKDHISFTANTSQSLRLCNSKEKEALTDRKLRRYCIEDNKQLSPVSVLEEIPSQGSSPLHHKYFSATKEENPSKTCVIFPKKATEDSTLLASLGKTLFHSATEPICAGVTEIQQFVQSNVSSQYLKPKMVLQQTKQLLFDCARKVVETQGKKEKQQQHHKEYLGSEELGKLIGEKINSWEKQCGEQSSLKKLFDLGLLDSAKEWSDYETQRRDIGLEIGDTIAEDLRNEIVIDMIDFLSPITTC